MLKFAATYAGLTWLYSLAAGFAIDRGLIEWTVRAAAAILAAIDPSLHVTAQGGSLVSPWARLDVVNGCEGTDALFVIFAALVAAPLSWRQRSLGAALAVPLVWGANQLRIVALFLALRANADLFTMLHGLVLPLFVLALLTVWFWWFMRQHSGTAAITNVYTANRPGSA